jgi:hypothetical protein
MATQWTAGTTAGQILTAATLNTIGAAWETYTPTVTSQSGTITSFTSRLGKYTRINKLVVVQYDIQILNNGTGGTWITITKPITSVTPLGGGTGAIGFGTETNISGVSHTVREGGTTSVLLLNITGAGYPGGNNARITGFFIYEAA